MKEFDVKISIINPDYNAEYETEYSWLERQNENPKFDSGTSWRISDMTEYRYREDTNFELQYSINNSKQECLLKNVCVLELLKNDKIITRFVISKSLISSTRAIDKNNYSKGYFYFYLLPNTDYTMLTNRIYIAVTEIPPVLAHLWPMS